MTMINVTPRRPSVVGMAIGAALFVVGIYLLWLDFATLVKLLKIFAGFFLLLIGLGIFTAAFTRRVSQ